MLIEALQNMLDREATSQRLAAAIAEHAPETDKDRLLLLADTVGLFLRSFPQALSFALHQGQAADTGRPLRFATGQVFSYLFDEADLFPERDFGILGLLDDAYVAHVFAIAITRKVPGAAESAHAYEPPDSRSLQVVRSLLPPGVAEALDRMCDNLLHVAGALFGGSPSGGSLPGGERPALDVARALDALASEMNGARPSG